MTHQTDYNLTTEQAKKGWETVPELMWVLINPITQAKRSKSLQAEDSERIAVRKGYANG